MNPLALVGGGANALAILGIIVSLGGGAFAVVHEHDAKLVAQVAAQQAVSAAEAQHQQDQRTIAGLSQANALAVARSNGTAKLKEAINATSKTMACVDAPAIRAVVVGLRQGGSNAGAAPTPAAGSVGLPSPATAAR